MGKWVCIDCYRNICTVLNEIEIEVFTIENFVGHMCSICDKKVAEHLVPEKYFDKIEKNKNRFYVDSYKLVDVVEDNLYSQTYPDCSFAVFGIHVPYGRGAAAVIYPVPNELVRKEKNISEIVRILYSQIAIDRIEEEHEEVRY